MFVWVATGYCQATQKQQRSAMPLNGYVFGHIHA
jgi:hypothetical protein